MLTWETQFVSLALQHLNELNLKPNCSHSKKVKFDCPVELSIKTRSLPLFVLKLFKYHCASLVVCTVHGINEEYCFKLNF